MISSTELRQKFFDFFEKKGHKILPSSSLIPENDPSVLFTTAGMQQFKKYYLNPELAEKELGSKNVVTIQKCIRTSDIDEVGDNSHLTFFEMMGNFSFGGYGRKEAIEYAHEFITKELGLEISYVTIYNGEKNLPRDDEAEKVWKELGVKRIEERGFEELFWGPTGDSGPCGRTTEIYCQNSLGEDIEIWNIVFNEYSCNGPREKLNKGEAQLTKLPCLGVDTGMGFERLLTVINEKESVYETDLFNGESTKEERIIADHIRSAENLIKDGVLPSNTGAGYVLRRLIRRAVRFSKNSLKTSNEIIKKEESKFRETLERGIKEIRRFEKINKSADKIGYITGAQASSIFSSFGVPLEIAKEITNIKNEEEFNKKLKEHQDLSRTASAGMFKGGLVSQSEKSTKLHTAHHLLLSALQKIVSPEIKQKGSNITDERLRLDFTFDRKLTDEEKQKVEDLVNEKIKAGLNVVKKEMPLEEAQKIGAQMEFGAKYPDIVSVYFIEEKNGDVFSKEFCGGPHVANTSEIASVRDPEGNSRGVKFKIQKEEASSQGVRRIKAVLI